MAALLKQLNPAISQYKDRRFNGTQQAFEECLHNSTTVYVGNLSFYTTEDQIFEVGGEPVRQGESCGQQGDGGRRTKQSVFIDCGSLCVLKQLRCTHGWQPLALSLFVLYLLVDIK